MKITRPRATQLSQISVDVDLAMGAHNITLGAAQTVDGVDVSGGAYVPSGLIAPFSGAISAIPSGYVICDGNNSTPNLTDKFVIHADADAAGTHNVGETGGSHDHQHTGNIFYTVDHINIMRGADWGTENNTLAYAISATIDSAPGAASKPYSKVKSNTGTPPFHALAYIMKT